ncbi:MAG: hypothetical protein DRP12_00120 [Candidatus Aenigmatarchaeota archaeon]|nr:MAG: hypothetical protein DRP12_00120 [Candidatus Aenigmarchaeota archaeon]
MAYYAEKILIQYDSSTDSGTAWDLKLLLELKGYPVEIVQTSEFPFDTDADLIIVVGAQEANRVYDYLVKNGVFREITPVDYKKIVIQDRTFYGYRVMSCAGWHLLDTYDIMTVIVGRFANRSKEYDIVRFQTVLAATDGYIPNQLVTDVLNRMGDELLASGYEPRVRSVIPVTDELVYLNVYTTVPYGQARAMLAPVIAYLIIAILAVITAYGVFVFPALINKLTLDSYYAHLEAALQQCQEMRESQIRACQEQGLTMDQCQPYLEAIDRTCQTLLAYQKEGYEKATEVQHSIMEMIPKVIEALMVIAIVGLAASVISFIRR